MNVRDSDERRGFAGVPVSPDANLRWEVDRELKEASAERICQFIEKWMRVRRSV